MSKINKEELETVIRTLQDLQPRYEREVKDLMARTIQLESQLLRLNHLLTQIRNIMLENETDKKKK